MNTSRPPSISSKKSKRRSWFSFRTRPRRQRQEQTDQSVTLPPPSSFPQEISEEDTRAGPLQFAPNRIATLYVTPSERNLYLAAMSQLDRNPQPLPLWSEPAPTLPQLPLSPPMEATPFVKEKPPAHPLINVPLSPKLVTSPGIPHNGLQIREEFRRAPSPAKPTRHALVSLVPDSFIRFTGFSPQTLIAVDRTLVENWPMGVWLRSEEMEKVIEKGGTGEGLSWRVELHGQAWKKKGSQELDSIRLLLALLTTLAIHGWSLVSTVQAAGLKKVAHNLLFKYDSKTESCPPAFFALSLPLPDCISLISMPNKVTPSILTAVRSAIASNSHLVTQSRNGPADDETTQVSRQSRRLTWGNEGKTKGVKVEGWVHPGVYRFWIAGMRRWLGGTIKHGKVDNLHPHLLTKIIDNLHSIDFALAGSIPLLPLAKGRDILFFSSMSSSGLTYLDAYRFSASNETSRRSESPVLVSPADGVPPSRTKLHSTSGQARHAQDTSTGSTESQGDRRVLPWSSILSEGPPAIPPVRFPKSSNARPNTGRPSAIPQRNGRERTNSQDSTTPLNPLAVKESPRHRNVLMKKDSLRRQQSVSGSGSVESPPPIAGAGVASTLPLIDHDDEWSLLDAPVNVGRLGMTAYDGAQTVPSQAAHMEPQMVNNTTNHDTRRLPAVTGLQTREGTQIESTYEESHETFPNTIATSHHADQPQSLPEPSQTDQSFTPPSLALGQALSDPNASLPISTLPLRLPAMTGRTENARVDVQSGMGVASMHGSIGVFPTGQSVIEDGRSEISMGVPPLPPPKVGSSRTRLSVGK